MKAAATARRCLAIADAALEDDGAAVTGAEAERAVAPSSTSPPRRVVLWSRPALRLFMPEIWTGSRNVVRCG